VSQSAGFRTIVVLAMLLSFAGACGSREHMNDDFGKRSRLFLAKQHVYAQAATGSPSGVDSEEAALIQGNYRKALGGEEQQEKQDAPSRVLLLRESTNAHPNQ
jgi:hypothetical protein